MLSVRGRVHALGLLSVGPEVGFGRGSPGAPSVRMTRPGRFIEMSALPVVSSCRVKRPGQADLVDGLG